MSDPSDQTNDAKGEGNTVDGSNNDDHMVPSNEPSNSNDMGVQGVVVSSSDQNAINEMPAVNMEVEAMAKSDDGNDHDVIMDDNSRWG